MGKSQATIYLAITLLIVVVSFIFFSQTKPIDNTELSSPQKDLLSSIVRQCTEQQLSLAIKDYGITNESLPYIEKEMSEIKNCVKQISFSPYEVIMFEPTAKLELFDEVLILDIAFPITITDGNSRLEFKEKTYTFQRTNSINIEPGATLMSTDDSFEIQFPEDIEFSSNLISIKPIDRNFNKQNTALLHGNIVYEVLPKDKSFNKPVHLTMFFDSAIEEDLVIGYYDETAKLWIGLPTNIEGNKLITSTDHFTVFGALNCQPKTKMTISIPETGDLFKADCQACDSPGWTSEAVSVNGRNFLIHTTEDMKMGQCSYGCGPKCVKETQVIPGCEDCKGICTNDICTTDYYGYSEPLIAEQEIEIPLFDACINTAGSNPGIKTIGFKRDYDSGSDIIIELINIEDEWEATEPEIRDGKIIMNVKATNTNGDACLPGMIRVTFFGIASSDENPGLGGSSYILPESQESPSIEYVAEPESPAFDLPAGSLIWPLSDICSRKLTCGYLDPSPLCNNVEGRAHSGLDWGGFGMTVYSIGDGEVVYASGAKTNEVGEWYGYGNAILIRHNINGQAMYSLYAHLSSIDVAEGMKVSAGQKIGLTGSTGYSSGAHLHFELRKDPGTYQTDVNPRAYLPKMGC